MMKDLIEHQKLKLLHEKELAETGGGRGFAFDVGRAFRYLGMAAVYGIPRAMMDAAANSARCNC